MGSDSDYSLRLPTSLKRAAESAARENGTTLDEFIVAAVAEKLSARETATYFSTRAARADTIAFDRFMSRDGGVPPREDDQLPTEFRRPQESRR